MWSPQQSVGTGDSAEAGLQGDQAGAPSADRVEWADGAQASQMTRDELRLRLSPRSSVSSLPPLPEVNIDGLK